jgi:fatty-acyl-CoA synthase
MRRLGIKPGDRVATLCWNGHAHLEAYFGIPLASGVVHTLNLRLHPDELTYIANHARDRVLLVDAVLLPLYERIRSRVPFEHVIVVGVNGAAPEGTLDYERLLAAAEPSTDWTDPDERDAAALCYTSGTTGRPKGVLYSHRALVLHALGIALADTFRLTESDTVFPVVPMFHANAWGLPHAALMIGAKIVFAGPHVDGPSLVDLFEREGVTCTAGVPTIWAGLLQFLDAHPGAHDLSRLRQMVVGGAAVPAAMIEAFERRHGLQIVHAWGMTEMTPLGSVSRIPSDLTHASDEVKYATRAKQGRPAPLVEIRARSSDGLVPWDGQTMGELEVRGAWVASAYFQQPDGEGDDRFTDDGWFRTGDIVTIDERGFIAIQDRLKDLVKSGGEWISSVAIENALMGHPAVAEAVVIGVCHPTWAERPIAVVVLKADAVAGREELRGYIAEHFPKWWVPDAIEFVEAIPRTSVGKFNKAALREQFKDYQWGRDAASKRD